MAAPNPPKGFIRGGLSVNIAIFWSCGVGHACGIVQPCVVVDFIDFVSVLGTSWFSLNIVSSFLRRILPMCVFGRFLAEFGLMIGFF